MRIELKLKLWSKILLIILGLISLVMGLVCAYGLFEALQANRKDDILIMALALGFLGLCMYISYRRLTVTSGFVEIRPNGLLLACFTLGPTSGILGGLFVLGSVKWSNLSTIEKTKAQGFNCLGLLIKDIDKFLSTKDELNTKRDFKKHIGLSRRSGLLLSLSSVWLFAKLVDPFMKILGYTGIPSSGSDKDILNWNKENYEYHVIIPGFLIPGGIATLLQLILDHRPLDQPAVGEGTGPEIITEINPRSLEERLIQVEELYKKGLLSEEEYKHKREEIISRL